MYLAGAAAPQQGRSLILILGGKIGRQTRAIKSRALAFTSGAAFKQGKTAFIWRLCLYLATVFATQRRIRS